MRPDRSRYTRWGHRRGPWRGRPGRIFFRFLFSFGFLAVLGALLLTIPFAFISPNLPGPESIHNFLRTGICLFSLAFPGVAFFAVRRVFRNIASPLGDVMDAADAVAEGDLTARVPESRGAFRQLADSFNRMAGELERADTRRRNLTADIAHELRNPIHILQGNLEGILDGVYEPTEDQVRSMLDETHLLTRLVEDLQTLSLAEAGQLPLRLETVRLADLLHDVRTSFGGQADAHGIELALEIPPDAASLPARADYERLQQVLGNLVSNALRHTPEGGQVHIRLGRDGGSAVLTVQDTGAGIPSEDLPYIFDRFWKGDKARVRRPGSGSGLGLAIAQQLVQAHGGSITADSEAGKGAAFTVRLPLHELPE